MDRSKEAVAQRLAEAHYAIEPGIELIVQLLASPEQEADPRQPVKLLEVNQNTTADGIHPVFFGARAASGIFYPSVIVEVTPGEYEQIRRDPTSLPNGWQLGHDFAQVSASGIGWTAMISYDEWRVGYAKQAQADLRAREKLLEHSDLPDCQQLHFLQMACEKLCKAHLCGQGADPEALRTSHAYISGTLPIIARQQFAQEARKVHADRTWVIQALRALARKIELLAPSVNDGGRQPANCEYPWVGPDRALRVPAEHNFELDLLHEKAGRHLLKVVYTAVEELTRPQPEP